MCAILACVLLFAAPLSIQCESDLAEAIPALEAAIAALNTLKVSLQHATCILVVSSRLYWLPLVNMVDMSHLAIIATE